MTIKEAILKSLADLKQPTSAGGIYDHIVAKNYYQFVTGKTPKATVHSRIGSFIRKGDSRVARFKDGKKFKYYLTELEDEIDVSVRNEQISIEPDTSFMERDLHPLLVTYLSSKGMHAKTIYHERSKSSRDDNQKWIHPDLVGLKLKGHKDLATNNLRKTVNAGEAFELSSYEVKREINTDYELKKGYFQAVSNSSWANYGWLVAFQIGDNLKEEIKRLSQSFGIGVIELSGDPFRSRIISQADHKSLDFDTISKIANVNTPFQQMIASLDNLLNAPQKYHKSTLRDLMEQCDQPLKGENAFKEYNLRCNIPIDVDEYE